MKRIIAFASLAILCQLATSAYAIQPVGTYDFTATPGEPNYNNYFDGSSISIGEDSDTVIAFSFYDTALSSTPYAGDGSEDVIFSDITSANQTGWTGTVEVSVDGVTFEAVGDGAEVNGVNGSMDATIVADPGGVWNVPGVAGVPDVSSTLTLMIGSAGLMAGIARRFRSRSTA